jgi:hypothetical protein
MEVYGLIDTVDAYTYNDGTVATGAHLYFGKENGFGYDNANLGANSELDNPATQNAAMLGGNINVAAADTLVFDLKGLGSNGAYDLYAYLDPLDGAALTPSRVKLQLQTFTAGVLTGTRDLYFDNSTGSVFEGQFQSEAAEAIGVFKGNYVVFKDIASTNDAVRLRVMADGATASNTALPTLSGLQVVSGAAKDTVALDGDNDKDVVFGDNGFAQVLNGKAYEVKSLDTESGGEDNIATGLDNDIAVGGMEKDLINGGQGHDLLFGDSVDLVLFKNRLIGFNPAKFNADYVNNDTNDNDKDVSAGGFNPYALGGLTPPSA